MFESRQGKEANLHFTTVQHCMRGNVLCYATPSNINTYKYFDTNTHVCACKFNTCVWSAALCLQLVWGWWWCWFCIKFVLIWASQDGRGAKGAVTCCRWEVRSNTEPFEPWMKVLKPVVIDRIIVCWSKRVCCLVRVQHTTALNNLCCWHLARVHNQCGAVWTKTIIRDLQSNLIHLF